LYKRQLAMNNPVARHAHQRVLQNRIGSRFAAKSHPPALMRLSRHFWLKNRMDTGAPGPGFSTKLLRGPDRALRCSA
jgi:hypothetical protein